MNQALIECVPNVSEGRDAGHMQALLDTVAGVNGVAVLHRTSDYDHHRSVITFAGPAAAVAEAALRLAAKARDLIDLTRHSGVHPRLGALDVLPFVPLEGSSMADCVDLAHGVGARIWGELGVPVYFYEAAAKRPERVRLEEVRRGGFEGVRDALAAGDSFRVPDFGDGALHPTAGAVIVGARAFLIAYNVNLRTADLGVAKDIARAIRASSGGFAHVKAMGVPLASRGLVQVSMNLTNFEVTPLHSVFLEIVRLAGLAGVEVVESELIGLVPRKALEMAAAGMLKLFDFDSERVVENRLRSVLGESQFRKT